MPQTSKDEGVTMENTLFDLALTYLKTGIELIGVAIITVGALYALRELVVGLLTRSLNLKLIHFHFGMSITLGLELMIGADIIGSLVRPNYYSLGILAIIVMIRTILSYFLSLELERLTPEQKQKVV
jgi:uncharacterized membrane protein